MISIGVGSGCGCKEDMHMKEVYRQMYRNF